MKRIITLVGVLILVSSEHIQAQTPVYFNIISHNESSDPLDYDGIQTDFNLIQPLVKELCDSIISKQAKYNMQVDANFINGVLTWENGSTNSGDILEWANNSPYIDVDGHNHFVPNMGPGYNPYNYSDLAYLLDSCGVILTHKVLGGVTYADTTVGSITMMENWTQYSLPNPGYSFPDFLWQADIVWGTASPGHVADYTRFGVWKPAGATSPTLFGVHDPNATITHIGGGCKAYVSYILDEQGNLVRTTDEVITNIKSVVDGIQNNPTSPNDFYTMNMLINFRDMPNIPNFADSIGAIIDGLQDYVTQGKIVWATLGEKYDLWYQQHTNPNDFFNFDCADVVLSVDENPVLQSINIYPNPTTGIVNFEGDLSNKTRIKIYNIYGQLCFDDLLNTYSINIESCPKGIYFVQLNNGVNTVTKKIIKN